MALAEDSLGQLRKLLHPVAAEKEGGLCAPESQSLQQLLRKDPGGAVIKGQGYIFFRLCCLHRQHKESQKQKHTQYPAHEITSFVLFCK